MTDWQGCKKRQICPMINSMRGSGHFEFDPSRASGVRSDYRPHLLITFIVSSNNGRGFMISSKSAHFFAKPMYYNYISPSIKETRNVT